METKIKPNPVNPVNPEEVKKRMEAFQNDLRKLMIKHKIIIKAQITIDGPVINLYSTEQWQTKQ